jgi:hypothetical protein
MNADGSNQRAVFTDSTPPRSSWRGRPTAITSSSERARGGGEGERLLVEYGCITRMGSGGRSSAAVPAWGGGGEGERYADVAERVGRWKVLYTVGMTVADKEPLGLDAAQALRVQEWRNGGRHRR